MNQHSGETTSVWMQTATLPTPSVLDGNIGAEVCVVGAGIAGLSIAYCLARAGKSVVVVDDGPIASGETERTTAHLSCALDDRYYHLESLHGEEGARIAAASHASAIDEIEAIIQRESIECDFTRLDGFLFLPPGGDPEELRKE